MPKIPDMTDEQLQNRCNKLSSIGKKFHDAAYTAAFGTPIAGFILNAPPQPLLTIGIIGTAACGLGYLYCRNEFFRTEREQIDRADYVPLATATPTSP